MRRITKVRNRGKERQRKTEKYEMTKGKLDKKKTKVKKLEEKNNMK